LYPQSLNSFIAQSVPATVMHLEFSDGLAADDSNTGGLCFGGKKIYRSCRMLHRGANAWGEKLHIS